MMHSGLKLMSEIQPVHCSQAGVKEWYSKLPPATILPALVGQGKQGRLGYRSLKEILMMMVLRIICKWPKI